MAAGNHFEHFLNIWRVSSYFYPSVSYATWTEGFKPQNDGGYFGSGSEHNFARTSSETDYTASGR
jgi:hypothetical protein